ncbi:24615_t:CDS:2 [Dentiscutata erythropus]|uniref:24615_t:CDS:1 n=1 Tax=Dentiscutata erythropus TaxID=1348616 RepID=A0A9N9HMQ8_9GLOM|nr:24615_t:CDS:2 [Dentiscutata erythropus]
MSTSTFPSSTSVPVKRTLDQVEDQPKNFFTSVITITKDYIYYLDLTNWQLNTEVDEDTFVEAFPLISEREKFVEDLKNFYEARKTAFSRIERILPKEKEHESFDEIQEWRTTMLHGPKTGAKIALDKLERYEKKMKNESQKSRKNKGIFDDVIEKYSAKYISSQSRTVENEYIFWSDNELQMDDSDNEFII